MAATFDDIRGRIKNKAIQSKMMTAEAAAALIKDGMSIATSGFTPSGYPKAVPLAMAERAKKDPFKINLWTGASVGAELDTALSQAHVINRRYPYQTNKDMRNAINAGEVIYADQHLSHMAQKARYGFLRGSDGQVGARPDIAIVEVCKIVETDKPGILGLVGTTSGGNSASFVTQAKKVIVEVNTTQPEILEKIQDVYLPEDPPNRKPIPIVNPGDRIGTPYIPCPAEKIIAIVPCDIIDHTRPLAAIDDDARKMGQNLVSFLDNEVKHGRLPKNLLPLQSGVGSVANAVIDGLVHSKYEHLNVFTEVIQDGMFTLIDVGKLDIASGTSLSPSPDCQKKFMSKLDFYLPHLVIRPTEISNSPEVARRLGVIAMNTAIEYDIYGHVNSTHIMGKLMNGIGGSGDFTRNGYLSIFFTNSVAKHGAISSIVPMCSHIDHTEHDVDVFITEQGIADVRNLSPKERAKVIIENTVHPDYKPMLKDYYERALKKCGPIQTPVLFNEALSWHQRFVETGSMKMK
jgi:succinyl-CoA:acetate CoA-transferase